MWNPLLPANRTAGRNSSARRSKASTQRPMVSAPAASLLLLLSVLQNLYGVMARTNTLVDGEIVPNLDGVGGTKEVEAAPPIHRPKPIGNDTRCG